MDQQAIDGARELFNSESSGVLSTLSVRLEGFPFGSVVPYCIDANGNATILISTIAQHTKNISADNRCSLTVLRETDDVQANGRICVIGRMEKLPSDETLVMDRYYRYFPKSQGYHQSHDFSFYRLIPIDIRFIGGFGSIHWISPESFHSKNPFHGEAEVGVVNHMNEDHLNDLQMYCQHFKQLKIGKEEVRMVGIDSFGFDVFVADKKVRFRFDQPVMNAPEARERLIAMSKKAKQLT